MRPDGVPSVLSIKAAAAALDIDQRLLLDWVRRDYVRATQLAKGAKYWLRVEEVQRLADAFYMTPDWEAAIEVDR